MEKLFYFICYPAGTHRSSITVIDEREDFRYEKNDFALVNDLEWGNVKEAIDYTKKLAEKHKLVYMPFESRYGQDDDEEVSKSNGYLYF